MLYDMTKELYLVVRDPIGIASLYQGWGSDGSYWVSSELKALVDVCERIEPFPPGSHLLASTGATQYGDKQGKPVRYYNPSWATQLPTLQDASEDTWKTRVHDALTEAVRRRLMCDVPYGVLLSGGLDSSLVAAIAARMTKRRVEVKQIENSEWPRHTHTHILSDKTCAMRSLEAQRRHGTRVCTATALACRVRPTWLQHGTSPPSLVPSIMSLPLPYKRAWMPLATSFVTWRYTCTSLRLGSLSTSCLSLSLYM